MEQKKNITSREKTKIVLGSVALLTVFITPYLNITQFSLSTNLFQSALYSVLLLGFWILAAHLLRTKQPKTKTFFVLQENKIPS